MAPESESIEIDPCPCCGHSHAYTLAVSRSPVANFLPSLSDTSPREKSWTRLFPCPATGETFQAEVVLTPEPGTRIKDVTVTGIEEEENG